MCNKAESRCVPVLEGNGPNGEFDLRLPIGFMGPARMTFTGSREWKTLKSGRLKGFGAIIFREGYGRERTGEQNRMRGRSKVGLT
jgi:hypothetical protein